VATDKVDSEIPSPGSGIIHKILSAEGDVPKVGQVIALISTGTAAKEEPHPTPDGEATIEAPKETRQKPAPSMTRTVFETGNMSHYAFLSPVIRKMARDHDISPVELAQVKGSGLGGRITRADFLTYLEGRETWRKEGTAPGETGSATTKEAKSSVISREQVYGTGESTIKEMDRMRKLIADHMVYSKQTAPHVTSFVESDVTAMIGWREKVKDAFLRKYRQKLTITAIILEAVAKSLKDYPDINVSLDGYHIIHKSSINIGMATALPNGNLIVPVIQHADRLNLAGMATAVNDLAARARSDKLKPGEIQGGTFTVTNLGNFGNIAGTPVINQPEVAILAVGAIHKKTAVLETIRGDAMGIRQMVILSLAYDHRIVDGALGGSFLKSIGDRLQNFDSQRSI
jgi:2-oxoglutarate dehydrogenase E2 component (dihydrolipoamide succinyltransferase)